MRVSSPPPNPNLITRSQGPGQPTPPPNDPNNDPDNTNSVTQKIVDATVNKTLAGTDRVVGTLAGMTTSTVGYFSKLPSVAAHGAKSALNLIQAETIGPNIKVVAGLASPLILAAAAAGAGIGLVVAVLAGAGRGFSAHVTEQPRDFTIGKAVDTSWTKMRTSMDGMSTDMVQGSAEIKAKKLAEGEDPWDIPLPPFGRTAQTIAATVAGVVIGGIGGIATAFATTASEAWTGVKQVFSEIGTPGALAGLATVVASPVTGILHGASKVFTTPVAAAAVAWKAKSLGGALKAAGNECFDATPGRFSSAAGSLVGGTLAAVPSAAVNVVTTALGDLGNGLKTAVTDKDLTFAGKALTALGSVVTAPVAGAVHGIATAVTTPFSSMAAGWNEKSLSAGLSHGVETGSTVTRPLANTLGAFAGGLAVGAVTGASALATGLVSEVGGGFVDTVSNKELNFSGKVLAGLGGIPGNAITALGEGLGTLVVSPFKAAGAAIEEKSASAGTKAAAQYGSKAVYGAVNPDKNMVE